MLGLYTQDEMRSSLVGVKGSKASSGEGLRRRLEFFSRRAPLQEHLKARVFATIQRQT